MEIKVLQLNVWNGGKLWDNLEQFLREQMPDIAFFQEVFGGSAPNLPRRYRTLEEFKKIFPGYFHHFAPSFGDIDEVGTFDRGNAIFSKFPITHSDITFFDVPYKVFEEQKQRSFEFTPRALEHCVVEADGITLNLFNHHGIWGEDGLDNARRLEMGRVIARQIQGKENVILAGDFNLGPDTETVKIIEKEVASVFGTSLVSTFNMRHKDKPGFAVAAVDMMFVAPNIEILSKKCLNVDVSDHLPLLVTLEI